MIVDRKKAQKRLIEFLNREAKKRDNMYADIASRIGVSPWAVLRWKTGERFPRLTTIRLLEIKFKVKIL